LFNFFTDAVRIVFPDVARRVQQVNHLVLPVSSAHVLWFHACLAL